MAQRIRETMDRFGPVVLESATGSGAAADPAAGGNPLILRVDDDQLLAELLADPSVAELVGEAVPDRWDGTAAAVEVPAENRGRLKLALTRLRWPADDRAALSPGRAHRFALRDDTVLRTYQREAVDAWGPAGTGVVVLPCGAGKTVTALAAAAEVGATTLILTTGGASVTQWERELARFTTVDPASVGRYTAERKEIRPVTLSTYQMLATRRDGRFLHLDLINQGDWGLVIYDEVHLLPSAVFSLTAGVQARRRLGLTATLVREDGREADVFTLIGPKRYDVPWSDLELQGWIAPARCIEVRVVPTDAERMAHARADQQQRAHIAAGVAGKVAVVEQLLQRHRGEPTLIIGSHLQGLETLAERLGLRLVTGATPDRERVECFDAFRSGAISALVLSKVGNFSIDLPEASLAIQVSGSFGSRQEEAQRLGRLLRPKTDGRSAWFYSLVARDTVEQGYSENRRRFLTERGYHYEICDADSLS
jgi:DNA excision repair protein ERCC-3